MSFACERSFSHCNAVASLVCCIARVRILRRGVWYIGIVSQCERPNWRLTIWNPFVRIITEFPALIVRCYRSVIITKHGFTRRAIGPRAVFTNMRMVLAEKLHEMRHIPFWRIASIPMVNKYSRRRIPSGSDQNAGYPVLSILYFLSDCKQKVSGAFVKGLDKSTKSYIIYMVWTMASIWWDLSRYIGVFYFF